MKQPGRAGLRLLAHGLTHVVQQGAAPRHADRDIAPEVDPRVGPRVGREIGPEVARETGPGVMRDVGPEVAREVGPGVGAVIAPRAGRQAAGRDTSPSITPAPGEARLQRMVWFPNPDTAGQAAGRRVRP